MNKKSLDRELDDLLENIELPSAEEIRIETNLEKRKQNGWHEKNTARYKDPTYGKKVGESISRTYSTEEGRRKQQSKSRPHKEEAKEKIRQVRIGTKRSEETKQKLSVKKRGNQNNVKPIKTPLGIFASKKLAAEYYLSQGKKNALRWIDKWLKIDSENFYFLDKQEYNKNQDK